MTFAGEPECRDGGHTAGMAYVLQMPTGKKLRGNKQKPANNNGTLLVHGKPEYFRERQPRKILWLSGFPSSRTGYRQQ